MRASVTWTYNNWVSDFHRFSYLALFCEQLCSHVIDIDGGAILVFIHATVGMVWEMQLSSLGVGDAIEFTRCGKSATPSYFFYITFLKICGRVYGLGAAMSQYGASASQVYPTYEAHLF